MGLELAVGGIPLINEIWYRDLPRAPRGRNEEVDDAGLGKASSVQEAELYWAFGKWSDRN